MIKWEEVKESKGGEKLPSGCYVGKVVGAIDYPDKEYIRLEFDIAEGDFAKHFEERGWNGRYWYASYKATALGMFKWMFLRLEESNPGWKFDGDEHNAGQFRGKLAGIVMRDEEYMDAASGEVKCSQKIAKIVAAQDVRNGTAKPMEKLLLNGGNEPTVSASYDDVPFGAPSWQ